MISIVTVSHKSKVSLKAYVESFLKHNIDSNIEFIIVENSQKERIDKVVSPLADAGYSLKTIYTANDGFGAACNLGAKHAAGECLLFVNPDIIFETSLSILADKFVPGTWGTCQIMTTKKVAESFDLYPEFKTFGSEIIKLHRFLTYLYPIVKKYVFPTGSFFFVSRCRFLKINGFDESFFLYYEETELAKRLYNELGAPMYIRAIKATHIGKTSHANIFKAMENECDGFINYCKVTKNRGLLNRRLETLKLLSFFSENAKYRRTLLSERLVSVDSKEC